MSKVCIPQGYKTPLSVYEMQRAIEFIKSNFQVNLGNALNLRRVSAPLFVEENSGLNDNLNGVERPVSFDIPDVHATGQVVHSLAKWKRLALKRYQFHPGEGLYTDMNATGGVITMSDFSSWGVPGDLSLKPEITAPGGNIYSTRTDGTYGLMSGTSMASPSAAGQAAVVAQYIRENGLAEKAGLTVRALAQSLMMGTAVPIMDPDSCLLYTSPSPRDA